MATDAPQGRQPYDPGGIDKTRGSLLEDRLSQGIPPGLDTPRAAEVPEEPVHRTSEIEQRECQNGDASNTTADSSAGFWSSRNHLGQATETCIEPNEIHGNASCISNGGVFTQRQGPPKK